MEENNPNLAAWRARIQDRRQSTSRVSDSSRSIVTASVLRSLILPFAISVYLIAYKKMDIHFQSRLANALLSAFFLLTMYFVIRMNTDLVKTDVVEFTEENYHSSFIRKAIEIQLRIFQFVVKLLLKPLKMLVEVGLFAIPPLIYFKRIPDLKIFEMSLISPPSFHIPIINIYMFAKPIGFHDLSTFGVVFIFAVWALNFLLKQREIQVITFKNEASENFLKKYKSFVGYVYGLDDFQNFEVPTFPKDRVPSVLYYLLALLRILSFHMANIFLSTIKRFRLQKGIIIFAPFIFIFEVLKVMLGYLAYWIYFGLSFALRMLLNLAYGVGFLLSLYLNGRNFYLSFYKAHVGYVFVSVGITIACFFVLEMLRHLLLELPLYD